MARNDSSMKSDHHQARRTPCPKPPSSREQTGSVLSLMQLAAQNATLVLTVTLLTLNACKTAPSQGTSETTNAAAPGQIAVSSLASNQSSPLEASLTQKPSPLDIVQLADGTWHFQPDSLAYHIWTNVLGRTNLANKELGSQRIVWDTKRARWIHNTNFYLGGFRGWSAYSIWNDAHTNLYPQTTNHSLGGGTTYQGAGIAVSPEHILTAGHMGFRSNWWVVFLDTNNAPVFRRIADYFNANRTNFPYVFDPPNGTSNMWAAAPMFDYYVALLDAPLPPTVEVIKIVPSNWWTKFDALFYSTNAQFRLPLLVFNCQHRKPWVIDLAGLGIYPQKPGTTNLRSSTATQLEVTNPTLKGWGCGRVMGGDSGSPFFMLLDDECCLQGCIGSSLTFANIWDLESNDKLWSNMVTCVNATMRELSARNGRTNFYTLQVKDLSKFPTYRKSVLFGHK